MRIDQAMQQTEPLDRLARVAIPAKTLGERPLRLRLEALRNLNARLGNGCDLKLRRVIRVKGVSKRVGGVNEDRGQGEKDRGAHLVQRPGIAVKEDFHALLHDVGRLLARERVLVTLDRLTQQRLGTTGNERSVDDPSASMSV